MTNRAMAQLTLFAFALATTLGGFAGGLWAGVAIGLGILLFALAWWADSRPNLLPLLKKPLLYGIATTLGIGALMLLVPPLRIGLRLLKPRQLLRLVPMLLKTAIPRAAAAVLAPLPPRRWADIKRGLPRPDPGFAILVATALLVMALDNLHSLHPAVSWHKTLQQLTIFIPLLALTCASVQTKAQHPRLFRWLPGLIAVTAAALGLELALGGPLLQAAHGLPVLLTSYNRGASYLVLMALPAMAGLWLTGKRIWLLPFFILLLLLAGETESRAAKLGLLLALPVTALALWRMPVAAWLLAVLPPVLLGWPYFARDLYHNHQHLLRGLPASWQARIEIWDYTSYRIAEHPFLGWGLGTSHLLDYLNPDGAGYIMIHATAPHPHNAVMQLWVELGIPGLLLGLGFAFYTLYRASCLDRRLAPFALGAWVTALTLSLCAFDFWTDASWGCFALTGFAFQLLNRRLLDQQLLAEPGN